MSDLNDSASTDNGDSFVEFCAKVRNNDPSILPRVGEPFKIRHLSENEHIELADALLKNNSVTSLELGAYKYTKISAEAMAEYVRSSKRLQRIRYFHPMLCCFMTAIQESASLKELDIELPLNDGPSNLSFENMLTHTQSLQSLTLCYSYGLLVEDMAVVAAARSGLKKNTTLRELTLELLRDETNISPILTSVRDHPLLQRLCLRGHGRGVDLTGLETLLLCDTSKITELDIHGSYGGPPILQALAHRPTLTKLGLRCCPLGPDDARELGMVLCNTPCLHSLVLGDCNLGRAGLAELAPALYDNTSIKVLDLSDNNLNDMASAVLLRGILESNKTMTTLDLSANKFGNMPGAVVCIADGLGSNSTLLKINLASCDLGDGGVSTLTQTLGSRNTTLQKLSLESNSITSTGVGVLLETSFHITDLDLQRNIIGNEGASLLGRSLGINALPNLTRLSLSDCGIGGGGFIALVSALEQNTSLLQLDLRDSHDFSERAFLVLAESLPEIKVLQQVDLSWSTGLASAMPLLLAGLRKNTSLFRFHVAGCAPGSVPPTPEETAKHAGSWMQEMERLGYRNRFLPLIRAPEERLPPRGLWPHALARVATLPAVIFEVLRSKSSLVLSNDTEG
jgi:hypothetical protein